MTLPLGRVLGVELAQGAVEVELLLGEGGEGSKVTLALYIGDLGAEVALAALDGALDFTCTTLRQMKRGGALDRVYSAIREGGSLVD